MSTSGHGGERLAGAMLAPPSRAGAFARLRARAGAYRDLAKLKMFDAFLIIPLTWTLLHPHAATSPRTIAILILLLVVALGIRTAESALDDVAGIRDGIDAVNYADVSTHAMRNRKPLLDGRLTEAQAIRYAQTVLATAVAAFVGAYALASFHPFWIPLALAGVAVLVVGYSWGPKLSYIGGQEVVVVAGLTAMFSVAYGMVTGGLAWVVVLEGLMLGVWLTQPVAFANLHDREGDRRAGRNTMAVRLSEHGNAIYTFVLFAFGWALLAVTLAAAQLPWWVALTQAPCVALQVRAADAGLRRGNPLLARRMCHLAYRAGWIGLAVANLIAIR